jgi:hypothetical protein
MPAFSNPTRINNPLFPISELRSTVLAGHVKAKPFKTETTLLPQTRIIEWPEGRPVETRISQYVAYLDRRIEEVALDYYAQADDGSVWYFGEDVFNYGEDGVIADTEGTWLAGREGPAAMIMPAKPRVGDVYRSENVPGLVFEEVTVKAVGKTVRGPHGPVAGAIIASELHQDGQREDKTFAPGYGEFFTGGGGDVEAMALAVPADKLSGAPPAALRGLSRAAGDALARVRAADWKAAAAVARRVSETSQALENVPPRLRPELRRSAERLARTVASHKRVAAERAALAVSQAALDLELRHRSQAVIDRARFGLWAAQLVVDAKAEDAAGVRSDVATLEWIRDRFAHTLGRVERTRIDSHLVAARSAVNDEDFEAAAAEAAALRVR